MGTAEYRSSNDIHATPTLFKSNQVKSGYVTPTAYLHYGEALYFLVRMYTVYESYSKNKGNA